MFRRFRRSEIYQSILEHVTYEQGELYLHEVLREGPLSQRQISIGEDDRTGKPIRYKYDQIGRVSPTTIRYLKVASDIMKIFGPIDNFKIGEIGGGYGGQCRVINQLSSPESYELFDLPEVLGLTARYLVASASLPHRLTLSDGRNPPTSQLDLLISNYAYSELSREVQELYLNRVVANSKRGYMIYNHLRNPDIDSMSATEFAARVPGSSIVPEVPMTHESNVVVLWGA